MDIEFSDLIDSAVLSQRMSKAGKPYYMMVVTLVGGYTYQYLCLKGEENVIRILSEKNSK